MCHHVSEWTEESRFRALCHVVVKITAVWAIVCWGGMMAVDEWVRPMPSICLSEFVIRRKQNIF